MLEVDSGSGLYSDGIIASKYSSSVLVFSNDSKIKCL